ncbi:hypothetical protein V1512DRAFT_261299 [Lipomyces arxii]|uniref:uncharacterized protein n=1 Tax=Lipomyces arxii TaxID=56418 RepID=UPI0034CFD131
MLLDEAIVLIAGSTAGLDFILLQLISSRCRVYIFGRPSQSQAFQRAKSRIHNAQLFYLGEDDSSESDSDDDDDNIENDMQQFLQREDRLDLVIFSSADNEEKSIRYILPTLMETSRLYGCSNVIIMKSVAKKPRTRMDSLRRVKAHAAPNETDGDVENQEAEFVKAKLYAVLQHHCAENVFVNATDPGKAYSLKYFLREC